MKIAALLAAVVLSLVATGCTPAPPPVSDRVQQAYEAGRTLKPLGPTATPTPTPTAAPKTVAFLGDSYTAGDGASTGNTWVELLSDANNWQPMNFGRAGTGYLTSLETGGAATCGLDICPNYLAMADLVIEAQPDVVIVSGGHNDGAVLYPQLKFAIAELFAKLRTGLPDAEIIAIAPVWADEPLAEDFSAVTEAVEAGVTAVDGSFIDLGTPLENRPDLIAPDFVHPNDAGHQYLATVTGKALAAAPLP